MLDASILTVGRVPTCGLRLIRPHSQTPAFGLCDADRTYSEKRPADVIVNPVLRMRVATGETEETYVHPDKQGGGRKEGKARASSMSTERRRQIAIEGAEAGWDKPEPTDRDRNG